MVTKNDILRSAMWLDKKFEAFGENSTSFFQSTQRDTSHRDLAHARQFVQQFPFDKGRDLNSFFSSFFEENSEYDETGANVAKKQQKFIKRVEQQYHTFKIASIPTITNKNRVCAPHKSTSAP